MILLAPAASTMKLIRGISTATTKRSSSPTTAITNLIMTEKQVSSMTVRAVSNTSSSYFIKQQHQQSQHNQVLQVANFSSLCGINKKNNHNPMASLSLLPLQQQTTAATRRTLSSNTRGTVSDGIPTSNEKQQSSPGTITKTLRVLDMKTVKTILNELKSVDVNSDGHIDHEELMALLRKHNNNTKNADGTTSNNNATVFTEEEIVEIGELFYAGRAGSGVSWDRFVEAIDHVVQREDATNDSNVRKDDEGNPMQMGTCANEYIFINRHRYTDETKHIELTHTTPETVSDKIAFQAVKVVRFFFDTATGWNSGGTITTDKVLNRVIYLETIAAVPGMVAAVVRHFKSLRTMQRDGGMLHMFLDEANNERMHLLSFIRLKDPNMFFRWAVIGGQFGFGTAFLLAYMVAPSFCHRFVGYVEEEACATYTKIIEAIESANTGSELGQWKTTIAPKIARSYWHLGEGGTILDLMYAVRADEAEHRDVNHLVSGFATENNEPNPVSNTEERLNTMLLKYVKDVMERDAEAKLN